MSELVYDRWADIYDTVYSYVIDDIPFYVQEACEAAGPVLELGCGTGRVALPIAQAGGDIVGLDFSGGMLRVARHKLRRLESLPGSIALVRGDMRDFSLDQEFSLVIIPFRGFLSLLTVEDQIRVLDRVKAHLAPGGRLIFNVFVPDLNMLVQEGDIPVHFRDVTDPETGSQYVVWHQSQCDNYNQIIGVRATIEEMDDDGAVARKLYRDFQLRYAHRWEIHHLLLNSGYRVLDLFGDFNRSTFDEASGEMIWVAELR